MSLATWAWHGQVIGANDWVGASSVGSGIYTAPNGTSLQRVIVDGGFYTNVPTAGQTGGRQQQQGVVVCNYTVYEIRDGGIYDIYTQRHFLLDQKGVWSSGSITDTNVAAGFSWSSPPGAMSFDAQIRRKSGGSDGVQVAVSFIAVTANLDGLLRPSGPNQGGLFMRVLTSS